MENKKIYDYYCTNCGNKIDGNRVVFDLAQMIDLPSVKNVFGGDAIIGITPEELKTLAMENEEVLTSGVKTKIEMSLFQILGYIGKDIKRFEDREELLEMSYDDFISDPQAVSNLLSNQNAGQTNEVNAESVQKLIDEIASKMRLKDNVDDEKRQDTHNYVTSFWIKPIFFEGTTDIYTIHYSNEPKPVELTPFEFEGQTIRGYCPECKLPILEGSGQYEHFLVGFLGAQSAGKTTLFVSMINNLQQSPQKIKEMGIKFPTLLCDGRYSKVRKAIDDNFYGWAVRKTDAYGGEYFNASLLITKDKRKIILTFVDIAGELYYDQRTKRVNREALQRFPLITSCHMYMLCTCVSQRGYGEAEQKNATIDNGALLETASQIYQFHKMKNPFDIPPMCLVITKVDMAEMGAKVQHEENPFDNIGVKRGRSNKNEKHAFNLQNQIDKLRDIYNRTNDRDVLSSLEWCSATYDNNSEKTYVSIISCSALGKLGRMYDPDKDNYEEDGDTFNPIRLDSVWDWILRNLGIAPAVGKYNFSYIPSYGESYKLDDASGIYSVRTSYDAGEEGKRTEGIYQMFLNRPHMIRHYINFIWIMMEFIPQ